MAGPSQLQRHLVDSNSTSLPPVSAPELGAFPTAHGVSFIAWATQATSVAVRIYDAAGKSLREAPLAAKGGGIFEAELEGVGVGALYKFVLDGKELPDPYARFLPYGVHGPARVEPRSNGSSPPPKLPPVSSLVIYELHLGTFTAEGTWRAARERLQHLAELGINAVEIMPIAAFAGKRGWGYDSAALFAPHVEYGEPSEVRAFIEAAHQAGLVVILDVVYNHFGPEGNYLLSFAPEYFTSAHKTDWGDGPDFKEPHMRRLVLDNVRYWLHEVGFDGLRLDATHAIVDVPPHIVGEISWIAKEMNPPRFVIAEDERNDPMLFTDQGLDSVWADDFHHVMHVLLTGEREGYYKAYEPNAATLATTINRGWLYTGGHYEPWDAPRGKPADHLEGSRFIYCLQNHDQVGNRALGRRVGAVAGIEAQRAAAMLLLFLPMVPMIFMGEEWSASSPFLYFTDYGSKLGHEITKGRREEFSDFKKFSEPGAKDKIPDPQAIDSFNSSRLVWDELAKPPHVDTLTLYKQMLALRTQDPVLSKTTRKELSCEAIGDLLVVKRSHDVGERIFIWNCGKTPQPIPENYRGKKILVASTPPQADQLPPFGAVVLAG